RRRIWPGGGSRGSHPSRLLLDSLFIGMAGADRGGTKRRSASLASSAARRRARSERSPSERACTRQAIRLTSHVFWPTRGSAPNAWEYRTRSSATVMASSAATSLATFTCIRCSFQLGLERQRTLFTEARKSAHLKASLAGLERYLAEKKLGGI